MKARNAFALLVTMLVALHLCHAEKKPKKPEVPEVMATAKTVAVVARDGDEHSMVVSDVERMTIVHVREAMKAWGRYTVVTDLNQADIVLVVRKGRTPQATRGQGRDQSGADRTTMDLGDHGDQLGSLSQARSEMTMQQDWIGDSLAVCVRDAKGRLSQPLWSRMMEGGLDGPRPALVDQLHVAVNKAFPPAAPKP